MRNKNIIYFKNVLLETATLSTCASKKVACLLIKDNRILAMSYNGVVSGKKHCNEIFKGKIDRESHHKWSETNELHAETNLLMFCAKNGIKTDKCIIFVSLSPCIHCSKQILASGIKKVYYLEKYDKDIEGLLFLKRNKIKCSKI